MAQANGIGTPQVKEKIAPGKRKRSDVTRSNDGKSQSVEQDDQTPARQLQSLQELLVDLLELLKRQATLHSHFISLFRSLPESLANRAE